MQAQKLPYGTVVAAADIKNLPHFIIILLSADSLLVDIYIFSWVRHVCNLSRMFSSLYKYSPCNYDPEVDS